MDNTGFPILFIYFFCFCACMHCASVELPCCRGAILKLHLRSRRKYKRSQVRPGNIRQPEYVTVKEKKCDRKHRRNATQLDRQFLFADNDRWLLLDAAATRQAGNQESRSARARPCAAIFKGQVGFHGVQFYNSPKGFFFKISIPHLSWGTFCISPFIDFQSAV